VGFLAINSPELIEGMIGASLLGCVVVPLNARHKSTELAYIVNNADLVALFTTCDGSEYVDYAEVLCKALPELFRSPDPKRLRLNDAPKLQFTALLRGPSRPGFLGRPEFDQLALTIDGQRTSYALLHSLAHELCEGRWLALGGGGYAIYEVVPRAWTLLFAEMVEPLLSLTLSPTMISASKKRNVIPAICDVIVDSRLLPETTTAEQHAIVRNVLGDGDYELESLEAHGGTRSPIETPLWDAVSGWIAEVEPEAKPAPICVAGFTDSHWFREAFGTVAYGFFPLRAMDAELAARLIHSADERIPVEDLELAVSFLRHAAQSMLS